MNSLRASTKDRVLPQKRNIITYRELPFQSNSPKKTTSRNVDMPKEKSREELITIFLKLKEEIEELKTEIEALQS